MVLLKIKRYKHCNIQASNLSMFLRSKRQQIEQSSEFCELSENKGFIHLISLVKTYETKIQNLRTLTSRGNLFVNFPGKVFHFYP